MQTCFTGDTLVAAENGQKRIDEIEVGDKVWAFNVETRESELKTVTKVYVHSVDEILHLYTDEGDIDTTANHPFYVIGKGWVAAGDLAVGDKVFNLDGTTSVVLGSAIEKLDEPVLVYNLEVEDFHSYFVGCVPKHTLGEAGNRANAGIEPSNSLELFGKSIPSSKNSNVRFAYDDTTKTLHRFFGDDNGIWHWSGATNQGRNSLSQRDVPIEIIRIYNLKRKGW